MATKQYFAARDFRYGTRMLKAGDPVEMDAPTARLYRALDAIADKAPAKAKAAPAETVTETAPKPRAKRKAPAKRKAK